MNRINAEHLSRGAVVYMRQSTAAQVQHTWRVNADSMHWPIVHAN